MTRELESDDRGVVVRTNCEAHNNIIFNNKKNSQSFIIFLNFHGMNLERIYISWGMNSSKSRERIKTIID